MRSRFSSRCRRGLPRSRRQRSARAARSTAPMIPSSCRRPGSVTSRARPSAASGSSPCVKAGSGRSPSRWTSATVASWRCPKAPSRPGPSAPPNYFALFSDGAVGPNLLDGLRLRADATLLAKLAHWTLDEQQGEHELIAWKAGPVRVVRRSLHQVRVVGIHLTAARAHSYFYPRHVFGPGSMKLPLSPGWVFRDITALGGADFRDLRGWRYHAPGTPADRYQFQLRIFVLNPYHAGDERRVLAQLDAPLTVDVTGEAGP